MEILPYTAVDITPGTTGLMNLWLQASNLVQVREHLCGLEAFKMISMSNYTDMLVWMSPGTCMRLFNPWLTPVNVEYTWTMDPSEWLSVVAAILWLFLLCILGSCVFIGCVFGGTIVRLLWKKPPQFPKGIQEIASAPPESQVVNVSPQYT